MSVPDRYWCWTADAARGAVAPVAELLRRVAARAGRRSASATAPAPGSTALAALRPDLELALAARAVLTTWDDDQWTGGAYRADGLDARPGDDDPLAAPAGTLHFAGEHTPATGAR